MTFKPKREVKEEALKEIAKAVEWNVKSLTSVVTRLLLSCKNGVKDGINGALKGEEE